MKWFIEKFETYSDRPAIIDKGLTFNYKDLFQNINSYFNIFSKQIPNGQIVALIGKFSFATICAFSSLYESNHIILLITDDENEVLKTKLRIADPDFVIDLRNDKCIISKRNPASNNKLVEDLKLSKNSGLVIFTSGTTGDPKAILHNLDSIIDSYDRNYAKNLNIIPLLGFDHIGGLDMLLSQLSIGATLTIPENLTPEYICETIENHKVNVLSASPTFLNLLLISGAFLDHDLTSLQIIGYGSEPMPEWLLKKLNTIFPWVSFQQKYGLSETNAIRIKSKSKNSLFFKIDDASVDFKVVENELWLKSRSVFSGYLNNSDNSISDDGWFKTGDIVETDEDGNIMILGRESDIINVGGEKVFPAEIESLLMQVPFIIDCQVFAEKSLITGNIIAANIVSNSDLPVDDQKIEIRRLLLSKTSRYKVPVKFFFLDSIQLNDRMKKIRRASNLSK